MCRLLPSVHDARVEEVAVRRAPCWCRSNVLFLAVSTMFRLHALDRYRDCALIRTEFCPKRHESRLPSLAVGKMIFRRSFTRSLVGSPNSRPKEKPGGGLHDHTRRICKHVYLKHSSGHVTEIAALTNRHVACRWSTSHRRAIALSGASMDAIDLDSTRPFARPSL